MSRLLIVHYSPTRSLRNLTESVVAGASDEAIDGVEVVVRPALEATADDVLGADGYIVGTAAHFGYMSGALKFFFDSTFLQVGGALDASGGVSTGSTNGAGVSTGSTNGAGVSTGSTNEDGVTKGRPFGLYVHGRYDTTGATRSVLSIVGALGWRQGYDVLEVLGDVGDSEQEKAYELGATIAALVAP